jgi:hypothetical protein
MKGAPTDVVLAQPLDLNNKNMAMRTVSIMTIVPFSLVSLFIETYFLQSHILRLSAAFISRYSFMVFFSWQSVP